tara:strand:+ start:1361 stop:3169 length:1809 start_codon:yes stop_codon:yes gene_type:complete
MMKRIPAIVLLLPFMALLAWWQWRYVGYVKDDTFISMRYARNLALGEGLVFNYGDRLEGYTNFLWVLLTAPAFWLGVEPLHWVKAMSCVAGQIGVLVTFQIARHLSGEERLLVPLLAAGVYAASPTVILWSMAGLEPTLVAVLCGGGVWYAMRLLARDEDPLNASQLATRSALLLAAGALCRPDAHAVIIVVGSFAVVDAIRRAEPPSKWLRWGLLILALLIPYHLFRFWYFGDLFPNTAYVKAAAGPEVMARGRTFVRGLLSFAANPGVFAMAAVSGLLALVQGRRRLARLMSLTLALVFMAYMVRIGRDEMKWYRLFLPVFPVVVALGADGVGRMAAALADALSSLRAAVDARFVEPVVAMLLVGILQLVLPTGMVLGAGFAAVSVELDLAAKKRDWHNAYVRSSEASFQAMGRYIAGRSEPGEVVVFQDMGAAPFSAPDQVWIDTIGILNRTVAQELAAIGMNPFMRGLKAAQPGGREQIRAFEARIRDYAFAQEPDWIAFVAYVPKAKRRSFRSRYNRIRDGRKDHQLIGDPEVEAHFRRRIESNRHAQGIARDPRFKAGYQFERVWKRDPNLRTWGKRRGYWLVLYRAKPSKRAEAP